MGNIKGCRQTADVCERVGTGRNSPHTQVDNLKENISTGISFQNL